jgi:hypothetical protein
MPKPKVNYTWNYFDDIGNNKVKCRICSIEFTKKVFIREQNKTQFIKATIITL